MSPPLFLPVPWQHVRLASVIKKSPPDTYHVKFSHRLHSFLISQSQTTTDWVFLFGEHTEIRSYLTFWQRPWHQKQFPLQTKIAHQNSLFPWHDKHCLLNVRPTLWMIWCLVMQQDKKSSHVFVFNVVQTAALKHVRCAPRSSVSHWIHIQLCFPVCILHKGAHSIYSGMTVMVKEQ